MKRIIHVTLSASLGLAFIAQAGTAHRQASADLAVTAVEFSPSPAKVGEEVTITTKITGGSGPIQYRWNIVGVGKTPWQNSPTYKYKFLAEDHVSIIGTACDTTYACNEVGALLPSANAILTVYTPVLEQKSSHSSTLLLDRQRNRVWVVNPDNNSVSAIDAKALSLLPTIDSTVHGNTAQRAAAEAQSKGAFLFEKPVGAHPRTLAQAKDGGIWVVNQDDATVFVLDPTSGALIRSIGLPRASRPFGIAIDPAGAFAVVTLEALGKLAKIDVATGAILSLIDVCPFPRGVAVTADGKRALVTRFISPADHGELIAVNTTTMTVEKTIRLAPQGGTDSEGFGRGVPNQIIGVAISPTGNFATVTAQKANTFRGLARENTLLAQDATVRTMSMIIKLDSLKEAVYLNAKGEVIDSLGKTRCDFDNSDFANAVAFDSLGAYFFVTLQGNNSVVVVKPNESAKVTGTLDSLGIAPQGLVVDDAHQLLFVQNFMSRTVAVLDIKSILTTSTRFISQWRAQIKTVTAEKLSAQVLQGKQMFYNSSDKRMTKDNYISCATCHLEGLSDRRIWDFTDRGEGFRKTTFLIGRGGTAHGPVHWSANFDEIQDFEHDMRGPFGGTGFMDNALFTQGTTNTQLGDPKAGKSVDLDALSAYVSSLIQVNPSPWRNQDGSLTADGEAGKKIFEREEVGCTKCHGGPNMTDSKLKPDTSAAALATYAPFHAVVVYPGGFVVHDVGTLKATSGKRLNDTLKGFDTPTLKGVWEGAPYLHDGSAATLMEVITTQNPNDKHGKTSQLTAKEKEQLVAYLSQLDDGALPSAIRPVAKRQVASLLPTLQLTQRNGRILILRHQPGSPVEMLDANGRRLTQLESMNAHTSAAKTNNLVNELGGSHAEPTK